VAYGAYSWSRPTVPDPEVPIHPQPDPGHLTLTNDTRFVDRAPSWQQDTSVPSLPGELVDVDPAGMPLAAGEPIFTPTLDPNEGPGFGPALTNEEAGQLRGDWVLRDDGSVAAGHYGYVPPMQDETIHPSDEGVTGADLYSPQTVEQQYHKGVGSPYSAHSWGGRRMMRWTDRPIDMHWWEPTMQPKYVKAGAGTPQYPGVPTGNNVSPYPANVPAGVFTTPDRFVVAEQQVPTRPWDESYRVDGTALNTTAAPLGEWGL